MARRASLPYPKAKSSDSHIDSVLASLRIAAHAKRGTPEERRIRRAISSVLVCLLVVYTISPLFVKANTVLLYPSTCLGGWQQPDNAAKKPDAEGFYSETNSAHLEHNTRSDLYCGSFEGDIDPETKPNDITVRVHWKAVQPHSEGEIIEVIGNNFASSTQDILDAEGSDVVNFTLSTTTPETPAVEASELLEPQTDSVPEETIPEPPVSYRESVYNFFSLLVARAYAQEAPVEESIPTAEVSVTPLELEVAMPSNETAVSLEPLEQKEETISTSGEENDVVSVDTAPGSDIPSPLPDVPEGEVMGTSSESVELVATTSEEMMVSEPAPTDSHGLFDVSYSFDGTTWYVLGLVKLEDSQRKEFSLYLSSFPDWDKLKTIQIKLHPIETYDDVPDIYVDTVELEVAYSKHAEKNSLLDDLLKVASTTEDITLIEEDGIVEAKGLNGSLIVTRERVQGQYVLALFNADTETKKYIDVDDSVADFPVGFKDGYMFILTEDRNYLIKYAISSDSFKRFEISPYDTTKGERGEVEIPDFPWIVYVGSNNFSFFSVYTGEVFSDENSEILNAEQDEYTKTGLLEKLAAQKEVAEALIQRLLFRKASSTLEVASSTSPKEELPKVVEKEIGESATSSPSVEQPVSEQEDVSSKETEAAPEEIEE